MNGKKFKGVMGITADTISLIANWILVASLVIGVLATYAIVVSGNIKERELKREIANTNERAAKLEKEAAEATLEVEQLKKAMAWRRLSEHQRNVIQTDLKDHKGLKVSVRSISNDPEIQRFARDFMETLDAIGIFGRRKTDLGSSGNAFGICVQGISTSEEFILVLAALRKAGLQPASSYKDVPLEIIVGAKSPL